MTYMGLRPFVGGRGPARAVPGCRDHAGHRIRSGLVTVVTVPLLHAAPASALTDADYFAFADRITEGLRIRWSAAEGAYISHEKGAAARTNANMLVLHSIAALRGHAGASQDARARVLVERMTQPPCSASARCGRAPPARSDGPSGSTRTPATTSRSTRRSPRRWHGRGARVARCGSRERRPPGSRGRSQRARRAAARQARAPARLVPRARRDRDDPTPALAGDHAAPVPRRRHRGALADRLPGPLRTKHRRRQPPDLGCGHGGSGRCVSTVRVCGSGPSGRSHWPALRGWS